MSTSPISVVLPVYNAEDTISSAIESILDQTEREFQFVIVDDGSTDQSRTIIKKYAAEDSRVDAIFRDHHGIVATLNAGIQKASGIYIARMDADDISHPERLEVQADFLDTHNNIGLVSCLVEHLGDKKEQEGYARYVDWINSLTTPDQISINRFIESPLAHPSVMFRSNLIEKYGGYQDGEFPEDYELWLRWLESGIKMQKIEETLVQWRDNASRLSRNHLRYSTDAFYQVKAKYLARWLEKHNSNHPSTVIWGAGKTSRQRAELLIKYGIRITHYIDVDPNKIGQEIHERPVWSPDDIPRAGAHFIVSYVGSRGVNAKILKHLKSLNYKLGKDFIFAA